MKLGAVGVLLVWNGTGAWYHVDTNCSWSPWSATSYDIYFGTVTYGPNREGKDGVYQSLGVFNTSTGAGGDIGFVHFKDTDGKYKWANYGNDATGWKNGSIKVDPAVNPWIDVLVDMPENGKLRMTVKDHTSGTALGTQTFTGWDSALGLNPAGTNIGWYRFDSIANSPENLTSGTKLQGANTNNWKLYDGAWFSATPTFIATSVNGYPPGKCCSTEEKNKITVRVEEQWYASSVDIIYQP
jgi:hypothetical protein